MKKILVPTDASEYSKRAFKLALELSQKYNAEIELLYVKYDQLVYGFGGEVGSYIAPEDVEREGKYVLENTLEGIDTMGILVTIKKMYGDPSKVIMQEAVDENTDMIVMGSHGYGAIAGSLLGSVSRKVLHGVKCPVLIVK